MFGPWDGTLEHSKPRAELLGFRVPEAAQEKERAVRRIWGWARAPRGIALHMAAGARGCTRSKGRCAAFGVGRGRPGGLRCACRVFVVRNLSGVGAGHHL